MTPYSQYQMQGMGPDLYPELQAIDQKQRLADLLMARGQRPLQGFMAGKRFYTPPHWSQGLDNALSTGLGAFMTMKGSEERAGLAKKDREALQSALQDWQTKMRGPTELPAEGPGAPQGMPAVEQPSNLEDIIADTKPAMMPPQMRPMAPNAGGIPMPPPMAPQGADMLNAANYSDQLQPSPEQLARTQPPPMPYQPPVSQPGTLTEGPPPTQPAPPMTAQQQLIRAVMAAQGIQDPRAMAMVKPQLDLLATVAKMEGDTQERGMQREFLSGEKALDRASRLESDKARIDQMMMMKMITTEQANEMKQQLQTSHDATMKEIAKMGVEGRKDVATIQAESRKDIAGMKEGKKVEEKESGQQQIQTLTAQLRDYYNQLREGGGITDVEGSTLGNIGAGVGSSGAGQTIGGLLGTKNQSIRDSIAQQRPLLMQGIMKATGMTAKQMDSNVELKMWLSAATDPKMGYQANIRALEMLEKLYGGGTGTPESSPTPTAQPSLDDLLQKYK